MSRSGLARQIDHHGAPAVELRTAGGASALVSTLGGQVLSWMPRPGDERLFLSERACFDGSLAIRGGIPVCWPQFADHGRLPRHGLVRTATWSIETLRSGEDFALATLRTTEDEASLALWPHRFALELTVLIEDKRLSVELGVGNTGHGPFAFTAALHSYLRVVELEESRLEGLGGRDYQDKLRQGRQQRDSGDHLAVDREIDRIYAEVRNPLLLREAGRSLGIHAEGFPDVVVWNPWEQQAAALPDLGRLEFRRMLCVEAALARRAFELAAGEQWVGRQSLVALA